MCTFTVDSTKSPDRLDALVLAVTNLMIEHQAGLDPDWEPQAFAPFRVSHAPHAPHTDWDTPPSLRDGAEYSGSILRRRI